MMRRLVIRGLDWLAAKPGWGFIGWGLLHVSINDALNKERR